jgi:hypothetical protein
MWLKDNLSLVNDKSTPRQTLRMMKDGGGKMLAMNDECRNVARSNNEGVKKASWKHLKGCLVG